MQKNFSHLPKILTLNDLITPFEEDRSGSTIDELATHYFPGQEIDVMSIDIDGLDHLILKNMRLRPKLIIIEGGMFWHPQMELEVPDDVAKQGVQQPLIVMTRIAKNKGYSLICSTFNAFYIRDDLHHFFSHIENDPVQIWIEALLHMRNVLPNFVPKFFQIRESPLIRDWEMKDLNIVDPINNESFK